MRQNARRVMELLPRGAVGAEVGTNRGQWTAGLRAVAAPSALTLIDPWRADPVRDARAHAFVADQAERDAALAAVRDAHPDAMILRRPSTEALGDMPGASLDWLWLDGDKQYDTMTADLDRALRVVRPGGMIAGGGWHFGPELGRPVRAAMSELAACLDAEVIQHGQFWAFRRPEGPIPDPVPRDETFLIVSTMKNEAPYVLEWVAHHRAVGFTDFLVFTNDCDDGTDALLDRLGETGVAGGRLTHQPNTVLRRGPHKSALKWARDHVAFLKADWILISDVDEFVDLPPDGPSGGTIQGLMRALGPETDVVSFPWKCFGNDGVERFRDVPVTAQFTSCEPIARRGGRRLRDVKTMFRHPEAMFHIGLHRPRIHDHWRDRIVWKSPSGEDISGRMNHGKRWVMPYYGCDETGHMHHYPLRSLEAYILKKNRGRANHVSEDLGRDYWDRWNLRGGRDRGLVEGAPGFAAALETLRADRGVRQLHHAGVQWHRDQFAELMRDDRYRALWEELRGRPARKPNETVEEIEGEATDREDAAGGTGA